MKPVSITSTLGDDDVNSIANNMADPIKLPQFTSQTVGRTCFKNH
jgi:hypothetical protein